jgi:hypothetical protein
MRSFKIEGIIIRRRNYKDADRMLTVFTKESGKIQIKAAGVRRITSRRSSHIELLNHSILNLYKGNGIPILTEAQTVQDFSSIKNNLIKVGYAYHLCELIDGLCPEDQENEKVFFLLRNTLIQLSQYDNISEEDYTLGTFGLGLSDKSKDKAISVKNYISSAIHTFEIELLSALGYWSKVEMLSPNFNTYDYIETILERRLKSKKIFAKLQ